MGLYLIDNINHTVLDLFETSQGVSCGTLDFEPLYPRMNCIIDYTINYAVERHLPFVLCVVVPVVSSLQSSILNHILTQSGMVSVLRVKPMYFLLLIGGGVEPLTRFLPYIQFMLVGFFFQTLNFLVSALGSSACAIAQSPVSATDQQRHQVSTGQVAQATAVQDGAS